MEAKQLVKNLGNLIPSRSFCVATTEWYNHKCSNGRQLYTSHCLSVLPGFDGSDCQRFEGNDVTELMEKVSEAFGEFCAAVDTAVIGTVDLIPAAGYPDAHITGVTNPV